MLPRLLSLLQLTRMALVFTAVADAQAALVLADQWRPAAAAWATLMSVGLYGYGMALNDVVDARRDEQVAPGRPLPSGRLGKLAAHLAAGGLLALGLIAAWRLDAALDRDGATLAVAGICAALIAFYDLAGKYLVPVGLVALGLVRFTHAAAAAPELVAVKHPLALLNFVAVLSTIGYALEDKRPTLRGGHVAVVVTLLAACDAAVLWRVGLTGPVHMGTALAAAVAGFGLVVALLAAQTPDRRTLGKRVMLWGLLWLIVIDAAAVSIVSLPAAAGILLLLPIAWGMVALMRSWSTLAELRQTPKFLRD